MVTIILEHDSYILLVSTKQLCVQLKVEINKDFQSILFILVN